MNKGNGYAVGAYAIWGFFPIYFKYLNHVSAIQMTGHRIIWSFVVLAAIVALSQRGAAFLSDIMKPRVIIVYTIAAILIGINWLTFVWAVSAGYIVESSLGYFINPLFSVLLGVIFLRERLRLGQWIAVGLAMAGVLYMTVAYGRPPWIALVLASSFAVYGFVKKMAPLGSIHGLTLETGLLFLPASLFLLHSEAIGQGAFLHHGFAMDLLLAAAGPLTSIPLLLFAAAAQRISLTMIGILQYIAPTMQFLIGVGLYNEPFTSVRLTGFMIVWMALLVFGVDSFMNRRKPTT